MKPGSSAQDTDPRLAATNDDMPEVGAYDALAGKAARRKPQGRQLQDIQELIDKLAAVTRQLSRPRRG